MFLPFIIVLEAKVLLGSFLFHPILVHVSIHNVIVRECRSKSGLDYLQQVSFRDYAIEQRKLVASSLFHRVHGFRQRLSSLLTEFMSIPFIFDISLVPCLASNNQRLKLSSGIVNDHCDEHIVVLIRNLQIGGSDQR